MTTDWTSLVRDHGPVVWQIVRRLLNHDADSADCFQRVFLSAWEFSRREAVRDWPAFLKRLATTRALEQLRSRYRSARHERQLADDPPLPRGLVDPSVLAQGNELADGLRRALSELDDRHAEVFCLIRLQGWKYDEVADHLHVSLNHVGVFLHRAAAQLRSRLQSFNPQTASPVEGAS